MIISISKGDTLPVLQAELSASSEIIDLTGCTVQFIYQPKSRQTAPTTGSATIVSATSGIVEYSWVTGDTATPGVYLAKWLITYPNNSTLTVPNDRNLIFEIFNSIS